MVDDEFKGNCEIDRYGYTGKHRTVVLAYTKYGVSDVSKELL